MAEQENAANGTASMRRVAFASRHHQLSAKARGLVSGIPLVCGQRARAPAPAIGRSANVSQGHRRPASPRIVPWSFLVGTLIFAAGVALGQVYPNKPVRIITQEVGGSGDFISRLIAQAIAGPLGQPVIVDNRPTRLARELGAKAPSDGYSLYQDGSALWLAPFLEKMPYDPVRDFSPITLAAQAPNVLVVHPSVPVKSVNELIALAKAKPGVLNYASAVSGSASHLGAELFKSMAGVNIVRVPYQGNAPALVGLMGGEAQVLFASAGAVTPQLKSDRLRALAVTSAQPSVLFPGLPAIAASGLPGFEYVSSFGVFAPAKTPAAIISRLNQEIVRALNVAEAKERLFRSGLEVVGSSPEALAARVKSEMTSVGKVIKDAGIKPD